MVVLIFTDLSWKLSQASVDVVPSVRLLELCGIGASDTRRLAIDKILDGTWAALEGHTRSRSDPLPTFRARLNAMARLSHKVAAAIDIFGTAQ